MELNNIFPGLQNIHNFMFVGKFDKHKYYKDINLFTNFDVNNIESNTEWDCKLQTNFPGKDIGLLKPNLINNLFDDLLLFLQKETKKYDIKWMKNLVYSSKNLGWYNMYKKGFSQERHSHMGDGNILSGVYYYKSPSTIQFFNPETRNTHIMQNGHLIPLPEAHITIQFEPEEGTLILFSNQIDHSVPKYNGDDVRISFAFNLGIKE